MNDSLKKKLNNIIDSLISWPICQQFTGPTTNSLCKRFDILAVHDTLNLNIIKNSLENNKYKTVDEFVKDVNLVWENGKKNKSPENLQRIMAEEASLWFNNKMKKLPQNEMEEWIYKSTKYSKSINEILQYFPANNKFTPKDVKIACANLTKEDPPKKTSSK